MPDEEKKERSTFTKPAVRPTQRINDEVAYDFNDGARVAVDKDSKHTYHVKLTDADSSIICFDDDVAPDKSMTSACKYMVRWRIVVTLKGDTTPLLDYTLDTRDREVLVECPNTEGPTLGDTIAIMSAVDLYRARTGARITVAMHPVLTRLFQPVYRGMMDFCTHEEAVKLEPLATVRMGLFWEDPDQRRAPMDHRIAGNFMNYHNIIGNTLPAHQVCPPQVDVADMENPREPYVCIAAQASAACKTWMGDGNRGWMNLVKWLKLQGYRVLCIDKDPVYGSGVWHNYIPFGSEDFTGDIPLASRARLLQGAKCFIGGSSGLAWLAWCVGCPVVMISGFTEDFNEFPTPYRVRSRIACSGCWNDTSIKFDHKNLLWCPRHQDDNGRRFECTRLISSELVQSVVKRIPGLIRE